MSWQIIFSFKSLPILFTLQLDTKAAFPCLFAWGCGIVKPEGLVCRAEQHQALPTVHPVADGTEEITSLEGHLIGISLAGGTEKKGCYTGRK